MPLRSALVPPRLGVGSLAAVATSSVQPVGIPGSWTLVFQDEFTGGAISESNYRSWYGSTTSVSATLAQFFSATDMATNPDYTPEYATEEHRGGILPSMSTLSGGQLLVSADNVSCTYATHTYAQRRGLVRTAASYLYGAFEARITLPAGEGLWPAFWLWPESPDSLGSWTEIDILEAPGSTGGSTSTRIYQNTHKWVSGVSVSEPGPNLISVDGTQPHVYGCKWTSAGGVQLYIDGVQTFTNTNTSTLPGVNPLCVLFDFQVGGSWPGSPDGTTPWPSSMVIDYLRIWQ